LDFCFKLFEMKKLVLALLLTLPFGVLFAQDVKVIPAAMNPSAKKEATIEYNPATSVVKHDESSANKKKVKCVPGCSDRKQCIRKTASSKNPPYTSEEKMAETSKK